MLSYGLWLAEVILANNRVILFHNPYFMIGSLFIVGICGGGCYVNVMYSIIGNKKLAFQEKELAVNICSILDEAGILSASITALIMSNFIYPDV